jgi:hypothetical protein
MSGADWSREEVEAIVADYMHMLTLELSGQSYNKTSHRLALQKILNKRSEGSIERKHQNISAALIELGCPYITGYKPLPNYQQLLFDVVEERVAGDRSFDQSALAAVAQPAVAMTEIDYSLVLTAAPVIQPRIAEDKKAYKSRKVGVFRDYLARETQNRSLGAAGEEFVVAFERYRLYAAGHKHFVDRVERVSSTKGDGLGYDVLSFDEDGGERFIEVKTTSFGKETPFYLSKGELEFSRHVRERFHLYRLYEFRRQPQLFDLPGAVEDNCRLDPVTYLAKFS